MPKKVNLRNTIVTSNSLNTRPGAVAAVVAADADFVVGFKFNQSLLEEDVITAFEYVDKGGFRHDVLTASRVSEDHCIIDINKIDIIEMKHAVRSELWKK